MGVAPAAAPVRGPKPTPKAAASPAFIITAGEVRLADASIVFADASNPRPFATTVKPLDLVVRGFSTARGHRAAVTLDAKTEAAETLAVAGKLALEPFALEGTVTVKGAPLKKDSPYYAAPLLFEVEEGTLDVTVPLRLEARGQDLAVVVTDSRGEPRQPAAAPPGRAR